MSIEKTVNSPLFWNAIFVLIVVHLIVIYIGSLGPSRLAYVALTLAASINIIIRKHSGDPVIALIYVASIPLPWTLVTQGNEPGILLGALHFVYVTVGLGKEIWHNARRSISSILNPEEE
jgi:hypothetical protein